MGLSWWDVRGDEVRDHQEERIFESGSPVPLESSPIRAAMGAFASSRIRSPRRSDYNFESFEVNSFAEACQVLDHINRAKQLDS